MESISVAIVSGGLGMTATMGAVALNRWFGKSDKITEQSISLKKQQETLQSERVDKLWERSEEQEREIVKWRDLWYKKEYELLDLKRRHVEEIESQRVQYAKLDAEYNIIKLKYTDVYEAYTILVDKDALKSKDIDEMKQELIHLRGLIQKQSDRQNAIDVHDGTSV
jgi:hypothetical protein